MASSDKFVVVKRKKKRFNGETQLSHQRNLRSTGSCYDAVSLDVNISRIVHRIGELGNEVCIKDVCKVIIAKVENWLTNLQSQESALGDSDPHPGPTVTNDDESGEELLTCVDGSTPLPAEIYSSHDPTEGRHGKASQKIDIVCYGLGHISTCPIAREQTALLMELKGQLNVSSCWCYDPHFLQSDCDILSELGCELLDTNEEGKREVSQPTIFFMPHCGKALYNNLLWSNWNHDQLPNLFIIGNSFSATSERLPLRIFEEQYQYIHRGHILPVLVEEPLDLTPDTEMAFSDTSCHWIPQSKLASKPFDFWKAEEPSYCEDDVEIILNKLKS